MLSTYHPVTVFLYFVVSISATVLFTHPACIMLSLAAAIGYAVWQKGAEAVRFGLTAALPVIVVFTIVNPLVNHKGSTILFYIKYSAITLEAVLYGLFSGIMFAAVMFWFVSFNENLTSDKLLYLFAKVSPSAALIITMSLRLIPRMKRRVIAIASAQKTIGNDVFAGGLKVRLKNGIKILSALTTWSLENSIETADSMNARGYGRRGRSFYSPYTYEKRDKIAIIFLIAIAALIFWSGIKGNIAFKYYPAIQGSLMPQDIAPELLIYALLFLMPVIFNTMELIYWKFSR
jgi:energy-coupling factor transport system permease protein